MSDLAKGQRYISAIWEFVPTLDSGIIGLFYDTEDAAREILINGHLLWAEDDLSPPAELGV